ncbi:MAG TPA: SHOCT domain-containing protein [Solirubrobacteraceae bacterium]|nr:SHOCT domain-containing protein [Solirubrobacteraceae bacterium]
MAPKERPVAVIAPSIRSISLYASGRIDYQGKSGSVIGATARIESTGEKNRLRDTRKVVLRIEGPNVAIAAPLPPASLQVYRRAQEFVAQVNKISGHDDGSASAPAAQSAEDPPKSIDQATEVDSSVPAAAGAREAYLRSMDVVIGQLERLGKLRDSGVLTEDEFQEQKAALLRATRNS